jgi:erythromycin esterase-like protein
MALKVAEDAYRVGFDAAAGAAAATGAADAVEEPPLSPAEDPSPDGLVSALDEFSAAVAFVASADFALPLAA